MLTFRGDARFSIAGTGTSRNALAYRKAITFIRLHTKLPIPIDWYDAKPNVPAIETARFYSMTTGLKMTIILTMF